VGAKRKQAVFKKPELTRAHALGYDPRRDTGYRSHDKPDWLPGQCRPAKKDFSG
jgi:hypothetical protein